MRDHIAWPELPRARWEDTRATLHMWTQVVGKVRLASTPLVNHWWNVPLYPTSRGLTTSLMFHGPTGFEISLDFLDHQLEVTTSDGTFGAMPLVAQPVSRFHARLMGMLRDLAIDVPINTMPQEIPEPIPFEKDDVHASYDPEWAQRFWRVLLATSRVFGAFRARFIGKASPVHFFWGSFDLAVTLFSGRRAPERAGADRITREAYSHEVTSFGFWPGGGGVDDAAFYAYAAPEPPGFADAPVRPPEARYHRELREFVLPYAAVCADAEPEKRLLEFLETTYEAGAELGGWDRPALERGARGEVAAEGQREHGGAPLH
ncbi:MAG TPA: DUF5996 family protein [Anaeromyxobacter sp.]|nr:DUF5996 family protein [Anaeromyxobacter sp.]